MEAAVVVLVICFGLSLFTGAMGDGLFAALYFAVLWLAATVSFLWMAFCADGLLCWWLNSCC